MAYEKKRKVKTKKRTRGLKQGEKQYLLKDEDSKRLIKVGVTNGAFKVFAWIAVRLTDFHTIIVIPTRQYNVGDKKLV